MTYAVNAVTAAGEVNVHTTSASAVRMTLVDVRSEGATSVNLSQDGKFISESQLGQIAAANTVSVGEALANSAALTNKYA